MQSETRKVFEPEAWHHIYHEADPSPSQQLFRRVTEEVFLAAQPYLETKQLWLDLGCGTGELGRQLVNYGVQVVGIDLDPAMLRWSNQYTHVNRSHNFLAANVTKLPYARHSVNGVVAASLTGCLEDINPFWRELSRVLVPGGCAVVSFTNKQSILLALISQWRRLNTLKDISHPCHGQFVRHSMDEVIQSVSNYDLQTLKIRYFNSYLDFANWSLPPVQLARKLESCSPQRVQKYMCRNIVMVLRNTHNDYSAEEN